MSGMLALATGAVDFADTRAVALLAVAWLAFFAATWLRPRL